MVDGIPPPYTVSFVFWDADDERIHARASSASLFYFHITFHCSCWRPPTIYIFHSSVINHCSRQQSKQNSNGGRLKIWNNEMFHANLIANCCKFSLHSLHNLRIHTIIHQLHMVAANSASDIRQSRPTSRHCTAQSPPCLASTDKVFQLCQIFRHASIEPPSRHRPCYQRARQHHRCPRRAHSRWTVAVHSVARLTIDSSTRRTNRWWTISRNTISTRRRISCSTHSKRRRRSCRRAMAIRLNDATSFTLIIIRICRTHLTDRTRCRRTATIACRAMSHSTRIQIKRSSRWTRQSHRDSDQTRLTISSQYRA